MQYKTQMEAVKHGFLTEEMKKVASKEKMDENKLMGQRRYRRRIKNKNQC